MFQEMHGCADDLHTDILTVKNASGVAMNSMGTIQACLSRGNLEYKTTLHVYEDLKGAILSRNGLKKLEFLPKDWPQQAINQIYKQDQMQPNVEADKAALMAEFSDVFSDDSPQPMRGPAMEIKLKDVVKPFCVGGARAIPYAYREQVKTQLDKMVADGIIEPVTEPSEWCHPRRGRRRGSWVPGTPPPFCCRPRFSLCDKD